jgi:NTP pyrophosphatase (non-canonical NTP hydrolase)
MIESKLEAAWDLTVETEDRFWPGNRTRTFEGLAVALASEVGEVCDQVKRLDGYGSSGRSFSEPELIEELTDVQSYLICFCMRLGVSRDDFAEAMVAKMKKVEARMLGRAAP